MNLCLKPVEMYHIKKAFEITLKQVLKLFSYYNECTLICCNIVLNTMMYYGQHAVLGSK